MISQGRYLFHGTRMGQEILDSDRIKVAPSGDIHVSLTSDFPCALYWAELNGRDDDEGRGCILVLHREALAKYGPTPFVSGCVGPGDIAEEAVMRDIHPLSEVLAGVIWTT
jgi:hypothetical protein